MKQMQVKDLYECCKEQIDKGNGEKYIVVADDNEMNGFHGIFEGFFEAAEVYRFDLRLNDSQVRNEDELIVLG